MYQFLLLASLVVFPRKFAAADCIPSGDASTINDALSSGGAGAVVQLCPNADITISETITFTNENQELSTEGYPTDNTRATLVLGSGNDLSTLVSGGSQNGIRLRNIQIDGNRSQNGLATGVTGMDDPFLDILSSTAC
jgi:hypothetical protein